MKQNALQMILLLLCASSVGLNAAPKSSVSNDISDCVVITASGVYEVVEDLPARAGLLPSGNCIEIEVDDVVLNLNDHSIIGSAAGFGITDNGLQLKGIKIQKGTVNNFDTAIDLGSSSGIVEHIRAIDNQQKGILLGVYSVARFNLTVGNGTGLVMTCPGSALGNSAWDNLTDDFYLYDEHLCSVSEGLNSFGSSAGSANCESVGLVECSDSCIDLDKDEANCGECGLVCASGELCNVGVCELICPAGQINCGGSCINPDTDEEYCGAFGDCLGGNSGEQCASGELCIAGSCQLTCPDGQVSCDASCVYLATDEAHCGSCGNTCGVGELCVEGSCSESNDAPLANDDNSSVNEGASVNINLAANDTDADGTLDLNSVVIISSPANGSVVVNGDGTVTYTHDGSETVSDGFTYRISDDSGAVSNNATVAITVIPVNDVPVANDDNASVNEGASVGINLVANDTDADGTLDPSSIVLNSFPANGSVVLNGDGTVTYTHDGSETVSDGFTYRISDGSGAVSNNATVTITVIPVNDAPVANNDNASVSQGASVDINLAANDTDADGTLDLNSVVIISSPANGSVVVNGDGTVTYTHDGSVTISDVFNYRISDDSGAVSNTATVTVNVNPD